MAEKTKGCKHHTVVDTMGNLLAAAVQAANIHDTKPGILTAKAAFKKYPSIQRFCADAGYRKTFEQDVSCELGLNVDISVCIKPKWEILPKRWIVERSLAWLNNSHRLPKDYEMSVRSAQAVCIIAALCTLLRRFQPIGTTSYILADCSPRTKGPEPAPLSQQGRLCAGIGCPAAGAGPHPQARRRHLGAHHAPKPKKRRYELWLLEDMSLVVVSRVSVNFGNGEFVTDYREIKQGATWKTPMYLNLKDDLLRDWQKYSASATRANLPICCNRGNTGFNTPFLSNGSLGRKSMPIPVFFGPAPSFAPIL